MLSVVGVRLLLLLTFTGTSLLATPAQLWSARYDGPPVDANDAGRTILHDSAGNLIVAGSTGDAFNDSDVQLLKYAADGALLWTQRYGSPDKLSDDVAGLAFVNANSVTGATLDKFGDILIAVASERISSKVDYHVAKYSGEDGKLLWQFEYNGPANGNDQPFALAADSQGNAIVTGYSSNGRLPESYTVKLSGADGSPVWAQRMAATGRTGSQGQVIAIAPNDDVIVGGSSELGAFVVRYKRDDGSIGWIRNEQPPNTNVLSVNIAAMTLDPAGNIAVTGAIYQNQSYDIRTEKLSGDDGRQLWENLQGDPASDDEPVAITTDVSGNVLISAGFAGSTYIAKYASDTGAVVWETRDSGPSAGPIQIGSDGNVVTCGSNLTDYVAKYDGHTGAKIWKSDNIFGSYLYSLTALSDGDVAVTGVHENTAQVMATTDLDVARIAGTDGSVVWTRSFNGTAAASDIPAGIVMDKSGNVIVTGTSAYDLYTAKYGAQDGRLLWSKRYNGRDSLSDQSSSVALDSAGNVIITGSIEGVIYGYRAKDLYAAKYAAADGALLWEQFYNGPDNLDDVGSIALVDHADDVVIVGSSRSLNDWDDIYTAKYSGSDGTLLWQNRFDGPYKHMDDPAAAALDPQGNVLVTGTSISRGTNAVLRTDVYTLKYSASNGSLLWQQRIGAPAGYTSVSGLLVDTNGNAFVSGSGTTFYLRKYAGTDGSAVWDRTNTPTIGAGSSGGPIAFDPEGNIFIVGGLRTPPGLFAEYSIFLAKFSPDGSVLWENRFQTGYQSPIAAQTMNVDSNGDMILTLTYSSGVSLPAPLIAKFSGLDGGLIWKFQPAVYRPNTVALGPGGKIAFAAASGNLISPVTPDLLTFLYQDDLLPHLSISAASGLLNLSWPKTFAGWNLQQKGALNGILNQWEPVTTLPNQNSYHLPISASGSLFFRLTKPQ